MVRFFLFALLLISSVVFAGQLNNFNQIKATAIAGKPIHIAIDFSKCISPNTDTSKMTSIGVFTPDSIFIGENISTSLTHFTLNNPYYKGIPIYEHLRYTISSNNNVNLTVELLHAGTFIGISSRETFDCTIGVGAKIYD